jgi:hypothetical protein
MLPRELRRICGLRIGTFTATYPCGYITIANNTLNVRVCGFRILKLKPQDVVYIKQQSDAVQVVYLKGGSRESLFIWEPKRKIAKSLIEHGFNYEEGDETGQSDYAMQKLLTKGGYLLFFIFLFVNAIWAIFAILNK